MTWTAGINPRFADAPLGASKSLCGVPLENNRKVKAAAIAAGKMKIVSKTDAEVANVEIPIAFDSAVAFPMCATMINDIRDQSNCGSCWAFGAVEAASDRLCIATNATIAVPLSAQEMCFCSNSDGCDGGDTFTPWEYIQSTGISTGAGQGGGPYDAKGFCSKFSLPHCHHHGPQGSDPYPDEGAPGCPSESSPACPTGCDSTSVAPWDNFQKERYTFQGTVIGYNDEPSIQASLMANGPVETAFTVYADFENYVSGVYQQTSQNELGGHAVKIVGWGVDSGVKYWKVANSWNPYWGEHGFFRILRGVDECGIESGATSSSTGATWSLMN